MSKSLKSCSTNPAPRRKTWGVARVSTTRQEFGIQNILIEHYLQEHPELDYQDIYKINQSAYSLTPKELKKIVAGLPKHSALIFSKADRFSRTSTDVYEYLEIIENKDLEIHFIQEDIVWNKSTSREKLHTISELIVKAEAYSVDLSKKVKDGNWVKRQAGRVTYNAPLGYVNYSEGREKGWRIHPTDGQLVKELFELYATGQFSFSQLSDYAYRKGLTGRITKNKGKTAKLCKQSLINMITNKFYIGLATFNGETYPHNYEHLIPTDLFNKCQEVYAGASRIKPPNENIISVFCGFIRDKDSNKLYTPYSQKGNLYLKSPIKGLKDLKEKTFYAHLISVLKQLSTSTGIGDLLENTLNTSLNVDTGLLYSELETYNKEKQKYEKRLDDLIMSPPPAATEEQINRAIESLNKQTDALTEKIKEVESKIATLSQKSVNLQGNLASKYQDLNIIDQHKVLAKLLSGIEYHNGRISFLLSEEAQQITNRKQFVFNYPLA